MTPRGTVFLPLLIIFVVVGFAVATYMVFFTKNQQEIACTLEAKLCPDGSSVGRVGPNCEFAACPETTKNSNSSVNESPEAEPNCTTDSDCTLHSCSGCVPTEQLKDRNMVWPQCALYDPSYTCTCINQQCQTVGGGPLTWKTYTNTSLGITFRYPSNFGDAEVRYVVTPVPELQTGQKFIGGFSDASFLSFAGITPDYSYPSEGSISDTQGFLEQDGNHFFKFVTEKPATDYPLEPIKTIDANGNTIVLLDDQSFVNDRGVEGPTIAQSLGAFHLAALMNLEGREFLGMVIINRDLTQFPQTEFESMLSTLQFLQE